MGQVSSLDHPVFAAMAACRKSGTLLQHRDTLLEAVDVMDAINVASIASIPEACAAWPQTYANLARLAELLGRIDPQDSTDDMRQCPIKETDPEPDALHRDMTFLQYRFTKYTGDVVRESLTDLKSLEEYDARKEHWPHKQQLMLHACRDGTERRPVPVPVNVQQYFMRML